MNDSDKSNDNTDLKLIVGGMTLFLIIALFTLPINLIIESVIGVGTLLTAFAALYSIKELQKQRRATYKPNIIFLKSLLYEIKHESDGLGVRRPYYFSYNQRFGPGEHAITLSVFAHNVGLGAAKSITVKYNFDIKKFVKLIQPICDFNIELTDKVITFKKDPSNEFGEAIEPFEHTIDYLLPAQINPNPTVVLIDPLFCFLLAIFSFYQNQIPDKSQIFEIPQLNMNLTYEDIGNEIITKKFNLVPSNSLFLHDDFSQTVTGFLQINEI